MNGIRRSAGLAAGLFLTALCAWPQYTVSAKPGVVNYIEGNAFLNGNKLSDQAVRNTYLAAGDHLSTSDGKAEVLLSPGVFLRIGDNTDVHMIAPTLVNAQLEVVRGEAMIEADGLVKGNDLIVTDHGASTTIQKDGLYRFQADDPATVAVLEGKALVYDGDQRIDLDKGHETLIGPVLKARKFDPKQEDELYAWSNVRSQYEAAASYSTAKSWPGNSSAFDVGAYGGYNGYYGGGPGWYWNGMFNSYAWLPGSGAFFSPFGYGFYSPGVVGYAPVVTTSVYRGGRWHNGQPGDPNWNHHHWQGASMTATVPVRLDHPPAVGVIAASPWANRQARSQAAQSFASTGTFNPRISGSNTLVGNSHVAVAGPVAVRGGNWSAGGRSSAAGGGWSGGGRSSGFSGGGSAPAAHASGGFSGGAGGGGHAGGGGAAGGGGGHH